MPGIGHGMATRMIPGTDMMAWTRPGGAANVAQQLTPTNIVTPAVSVLVQALAGNTDVVYVGPGNVGIGLGGAFLAASESIVINIDDASKLWIRSATATQGVSILLVR